MDYLGCQPLNKKLYDRPNKITVFVNITVRLVKSSQCEEYFPKH